MKTIIVAFVERSQTVETNKSKNQKYANNVIEEIFKQIAYNRSMNEEEINDAFLELMMSNRVGLDENLSPDPEIFVIPEFVVTVIPSDIYDVWVLFLELYGNHFKN